MKLIFAAVAALFLSTLAAAAGPIDTITVNGTWNSGTKDPNGIFKPAGSDLGGTAWTAVYSFDPSTLILQTMGCSSNCTFKFTSITATLTVGSMVQTVTALNSGTLQVCAAANGCGSIRFQIQGVNTGSGSSGLIIGDLHDFSNDGTQFFTSTNLSSNPTFLSVTEGSTGSLQDDTTIAGIRTTGFKNSATLNAVTTAVPEPFTLSVFGAGVIGAAAMRRRKKKA
jgi:hypothetical protein